MSDPDMAAVPPRHSHSFLGSGHEESERKAWVVIWVCGAMMVAEVIGGWLFGSIALIADGVHMSTHAGALLLTALAYAYARRHADDPRFSFGTGKLGDLAGFASAIILGMISFLVAYEAASRLMDPVPIHFGEAIPIACLGLAVNIASAWLLTSGHDHHHGHGDDIDEGAHPPSTAGRDNNMRAAVIHVMADAMVSVLVIIGLVLALVFGWLWMDPLAGIVGACVIASWSYGLIRDTGGVLLDMNPDRRMADDLRQAIERGGDEVGDLHLWRLGPGHLAAILSVNTHGPRDPDYYRAKLAQFRSLSHLTVEVHSLP